MMTVHGSTFTIIVLFVAYLILQLDDDEKIWSVKCDIIIITIVEQ